MPLEIGIVPVMGQEAVHQFRNGELDLLPAPFFLTRDLGSQVLHNNDYNVHQTLPIQVLMISFSSKAKKRFSPQQRMFAGQIIGKTFSELRGHALSQPTQQFFQSLSAGTLNANQLDSINELRLRSKEIEFKEPIVFGATKLQYELLKDKLKDYPQIELMQFTDHPWFNSPKAQHDMMIITTDTAWTEDLSLLGYGFEMGDFSIPDLNSAQWMNEYIHTANREDRIKKLNQLHFDVLKNASIVPIEVAPYFVLSKKSWNLNQSKFSAGTSLWQMRKN